MVVPIDEREQDNRTLRTLIITALTETGQTRDTLYAKSENFIIALLRNICTSIIRKTC